jgi:hypothetical protein
MRYLDRREYIYFSRIPPPNRSQRVAPILESVDEAQEVVGEIPCMPIDDKSLVAEPRRFKEPRPPAVGQVSNLSFVAV